MEIKFKNTRGLEITIRSFDERIEIIFSDGTLCFVESEEGLDRFIKSLKLVGEYVWPL